MPKPNTKLDLFSIPAVEVYEMVLAGSIGKFPDGFWQRPEAEHNAIEVTKHLIEDILNIIITNLARWN